MAASNWLGLMGMVGVLLLARPSTADEPPITVLGDSPPKLAPPYPTGTPLSDPVADAAGWNGAALPPLERIDLAPLLAEDDARRAEPGHPFRVGIARDLPGVLTPRAGGALSVTKDRRIVWRVRLESDGASAIGVHFSRFDLKPGAQVLIRGADSAIPWARYDLRGPNQRGAFCAPPVEGQVLYLEYQGPVGVDELPAIEVDSIGHIYRDARTGLPPGATPRLQSCEVDVMCYATDGTARDASGRMLYLRNGNFFACSGTLLRPANADWFAAFFMTANHCISTQAEVDSLTVYWLYRSSVCNGAPPPLSSVPRTIGGLLIQNSTDYDYCFIRLGDDVNQGQSRAGWTTGGIGEGVGHYAFHHPDGSHERFAVGIPRSTGPRCDSIGYPDSRYAYMHYNLGTTEPGSSGSGIFECGSACGPPWLFKGQLAATCWYTGSVCEDWGDVCSQDCYNAVYGRFSGYYQNLQGSLLATGGAPDLYEENDTFAQAADLGSGLHYLYLLDFEDYFRLTISQPTAISLTADFSQDAVFPADATLRLYNAAQSLLQTSTGTTTSQTLVRAVSPGTYYLRASRTRGWGCPYQLTIEQGCGVWSEALSAPDRRQKGAAVFDSVRNQVVMFGGDNIEGALGQRYGDTWAWNGSAWERKAVSGPSARTQHAMAFDAARGRAVLFGGNNGASLSDTWTWDGAAWSQPPSPNNPSVRYAHAMAYDADRQNVVLFGGNQGGTWTNETWTWNGTAWTYRCNCGPSGRGQVAMAWDPIRHVVVLHGGYNNSGVFGDTWTWDGTSWTQAATTGPSARQYHQMVFDPTLGKVVLFGGDDGGSGYLNDAWAWDGTAWTVLTPTPGIPARSGHSLAYDAARSRVVLFGGWGPTTKYLNDTWTRDSAAWTRASDGTPEARDKPAAAFDSARGNVVFFGGGNFSGSFNPPRFGDTWTWDGAAWSKREVPGPSRRTASMMAFDAARGKVLLFGGYDGANELNDTWTWDGAAWTMLSNVNAPSGRDNGAMVYDADRQNILLFGGFNVGNETWTWNGTAWTYVCNCGPSPREGSAIAFDPVHHVVVLFGGFNGGTKYSDTWIWNGTTWSQAASTGPSARSYPRMVFDGALGRVVLYGGYDGAYNLNDVWTWDGTSWASGQVAAQMPGRAAHGMVYDGQRNQTIIVGGYGDAGWLGDSWVLRNAPAIGTHPLPRTVLTPATFQLTAAASGSPPLAFQWRRNGLALSNGGGLSGVTTATLTFNPALVAQSGTYDVVVSDACGTPTTSNPAPVTIWCMGDWNHDHAVTPADVAAYINDWSAATSSGSLGPDVDGSGAVNPSDVATFINNWFGQTGQAC